MVQRRIAYVAVCYEIEHSGVYKKILDQVSLWKSLGNAVQLFVITNEEGQRYWKEFDQDSVVLVDRSFWNKVLNRIKLISLASKHSPSLIYLRDTFPLRIPRVLTPIVIEIQSLVGQELRMRSRFRYLTFVLLKRWHYRNLTGAIFVTNELMMLNEFGLRSSVPKFVVGNSINLNRVDALPPASNLKPSLLFIGTPNQEWHGISELAEFARLNLDIRFDVVGTSGKSLSPNVHFHGFLNSRDYWSVAAKCVAGLGPLNLSVNRMTEASSLKVREYLALGLPVVLKYKDVDLDPKANFVLQLPANGRRLNEFSAEIRSFLDEWAHKRVVRSQILHLDTSIKEETRLGFFEMIISEHSSKDF